MTCFLRNAFLALVAFATLAIIVMMAMTVEAAEAKDPKPTAETATPADTARQIVVEEKAKPSDTVTPAKDEAAPESRNRRTSPRGPCRRSGSCSQAADCAAAEAEALYCLCARLRLSRRLRSLRLAVLKVNVSCPALCRAFTFLKTWIAGPSPAEAIAGKSGHNASARVGGTCLREAKLRFGEGRQARP